jgi:hypothetical protein
MKGRFYTQIIRKYEADYLRKNGYGYFVNHGHGSYNKYYVVEDNFIKKLLNDFRKSIIKK